MPQIMSNVTLQPVPRTARSQELFSNLYASLQTTSDLCRPSTPVRHIREDDYTVPAPPPPSPVSFRNDGWPKSRRS